MFSWFLVRGHSMSPFGRSPVGREPSSNEGDFVLVNRISYLFSRPKVGQLVVLKDPRDSSRLILKRVTGARDSSFWVEGDNFADSRDSRQFGWVPKTALVGRAFVIHR